MARILTSRIHRAKGYRRVSTGSGAASPREHLAWGAGCDRIKVRFAELVVVQFDKDSG
jgi:hypothetical protein